MIQIINFVPMKNKTFLLLSLFLWLIWSCNPSKQKEEIATEPVTSTSDYFHSDQVLISAHRGGSGLKNYPENCLETMQYLRDHGVNLFEIDITESSDHQLLLMHDDHFERTTTGTGSLEGKTAAELRQVNLVDDFGNATTYKMPFLKDVLAWGKKEHAYFMIDFKKGVSYQKVIKEIRDADMQDQVALISYSVAQAEKLHKLAPEMMISVSARNQQELDWILATDIPHDKMVAFTGTKLSSKQLYKNLEKLGIPVNLGTLGNLDKSAEARGDDLYKKWHKEGVNIFSTDRPLEVYHVFH
ncbi:glycerophosphodiester phosphodiesterase [Ornithobacterium rhinotracheale]|uniref:glycerophosphodiester phosphodiesterase family protein n=1 Tax=Ornithobacterium rhinotracheale TaxID=28251 RepID=UPI00129CEB2F|nr:glycerophosphodiester phosphodiesterase family protein [Ornithobacterium rhinotracheale]MRJ10575.1 glycerophosphodiester phosphodiesterase [Ornithobacterium rhinotracheale]